MNITEIVYRFNEKENCNFKISKKAKKKIKRMTEDYITKIVNSGIVNCKRMGKKIVKEGMISS